MMFRYLFTPNDLSSSEVSTKINQTAGTTDLLLEFKIRRCLV